MKMNEIQLARWLDRARALVEEEKYLHAAQVYRRLVESEPGFVLPYLELAGMFTDTGQLGAGIDILRRADRRFKHNPEVIYLLGSLYLARQEYTQALRCFNRLAGEHLPHVHFKMGVAYFYMEEIDRAEEQFRRTLSLDPQFPHVNESIGELLLKRGAFDDAIAYLRRGISADPYSGASHFLLGLAYSRLGRWRVAYDEFVLGIDMDPGESIYWQMCGESLIELKRYDEAEQYLRKALELEPETVEVLIQLSRVFTLRGDIAHAAQWLKSAQRIEPDNPVVRRLLETGQKEPHQASTN